MSSSPSDQLSHGSLPPWPPMDFSNSLSFLLQDDPRLPPSFIPSPQLPSSSPSPPLTSPQLLSSQASMGASSAKVSKRKSRASNKPPIRVLSADRASFRDMVQKLTGIPISPSLQGSGRLWGSPGAAIFRPMATRPGGLQGEVAALQSAMPTLDTSSAYLSRGGGHNNPAAYLDAGKGRLNASFDEGGGGRRRQQAANFDPSGYNSAAAAASFESRGGGGGAAGPMFEGWAACNEGRLAMDMESLEHLRRASELESLFMGSSKLEDLLQGSPWFSGDALHAPSPKVEIAHSA